MAAPISVERSSVARQRSTPGVGGWAIPIILLASSTLDAQSTNDRPPLELSPETERQQIDRPTSRYGGIYAPAVMDVWSERLRAEGEFLIDLQIARGISIENDMRDLDRIRKNWLIRLDKVKIRREKAWQEWEAVEDKKERAIQEKLNTQARRDVRRLEHDITPTEATRGTVLNQLLDIIKRSSSSDQSLGDLSAILAQTTPIKLPPRATHQLRLLDGVGHTAAEVGLKEGYRYDPPAVLLKPPYDTQQAALEASRQRMLDAVITKKDVSDDDFNQANESLHAIIEIAGKEFKEWKSTNPTFSSTTPEYVEFRKIREFCQQMESQLVYLAADALPPEQFKGENIQDLIAHMSRYGLRFAPGEQNASSTYLPLYEGMRSISKTLIAKGVVADPETILPNNVPQKTVSIDVEPVEGE